jgi:hypothetical protein
VDAAASDVCSWQRPNEIDPDAKLFIGGADDSDVMQGALGDCWFLAALCGTHNLLLALRHTLSAALLLLTLGGWGVVVAKRTDLLQQLFVSCHPEHGLYVDASTHACTSQPKNTN